MSKASENISKLLKSKTVVISGILIVALAAGGVVIAGQIAAENDRIAALEIARKEAQEEKSRLTSLFRNAVKDGQPNFYLLMRSGIEISPDNLSMTLDGWGDNDEWTVTSMGTEITMTVLDRLNIPDSVKQKMNFTNLIMGTQEATWDDIKASWTFSPGSGLDVSLEIVTPIPLIPEVE